MRACPEMRRPPQVGVRTQLPEPETVQQVWGGEDPRPHFRSPSGMDAGGACSPAQEAGGGQPVPEDAPAPYRAGGGEEPASQPPPEEVPPLPPESSQTPHHSTPNCPTRVAPKPEKSVSYDVSTVYEIQEPPVTAHVCAAVTVPAGAVTAVKIEFASDSTCLCGGHGARGSCDRSQDRIRK